MGAGNNENQPLFQTYGTRSCAQNALVDRTVASCKAHIEALNSSMTLHGDTDFQGQRRSKEVLRVGSSSHRISSLPQRRAPLSAPRRRSNAQNRWEAHLSSWLYVHNKYTGKAKKEREPSCKLLWCPQSQKVLPRGTCDLPVGRSEPPG